MPLHALDAPGATFPSWQPHVRAACYNNTLVVFNAAADEFLFFAEEDASSLRAAYETPLSPQQRAPEMLEELVDAGLIRVSRSPAPFLTDDKTSDGTFECHWPTSRSHLSGTPATGLVLRALADFSFVKLCKARRNLQKMLARLQPAAGPGRPRGSVDLASFVGSVEAAVGTYPLPVSCLEWSFALAKSFQRAGVPARFVVGVQTHPFVSHAWVEVANTVFGAPFDVRQQMAVIVDMDVQRPGGPHAG